MEKEIENLLKLYRNASALNKSNLMRILETLDEECEARETLREWLLNEQYTDMTSEAVAAYLDSIGA